MHRLQTHIVCDESLLHKLKERHVNFQKEYH